MKLVGAVRRTSLPSQNRRRRLGRRLVMGSGTGLLLVVSRSMMDAKHDDRGK